jgi:hypothetical protein
LVAVHHHKEFAMPEPTVSAPPYRWEHPVRLESACRGCGNPKVGSYMLVCWHCFKGRKVCFKYFPSNWPHEPAAQHFNNWLRAIGRGEFVVAEESAVFDPLQDVAG